MPKEIVLYLCRDEQSKKMLQDFQSELNLLPKPDRPKLKVKLVKINDPRDFPSFLQQLEELYGGVYTLEFKKLNIEKLPAIVVDGEKVSEGKYLSKEEIRDLLGLPVKIEAGPTPPVSLEEELPQVAPITSQPKPQPKKEPEPITLPIELEEPETPKPIEAEASIDERLMRASEEGDAESVEMLLKKGANPNYRNKDGRTPLHIAAYHGHADVAELLIKNGADINARDNDGWTPLHDAAYKGRGEVVRLLLERGADPTVRGNDGRSPLDVARESGQSEVARVIEEFIGSRLAILGVEAPELYAGEWDARAICPVCGNKLVFIKTLNRYYCFKCKDYR